MLALLIYTAVRGRNRGRKINCILQVLFMAAQKQRMERTAGELGTRGAQLQRTEFTMCQNITCIQYIYNKKKILRFNKIIIYNFIFSSFSASDPNGGPHFTGCRSREQETFRCWWSAGTFQNLTEPGALRVFYQTMYIYIKYSILSCLNCVLFGRIFI